MTIKAWAAREAGGSFEPLEFEPGALGDDQIEVEVRSCGICHSDLSMLNNDWGMSAYPFVGGHEVVGRVSAVGAHTPSGKVKVGDVVGVGWFSGSCMHCRQCMAGRHNLCASAEGIIVGRHGGFADRVRCHWGWASVLPEGVDPKKAGPLFCGGITVFNPIVQHGVDARSRVGVIGIGGLGHMALMFLGAWGCEVTAFSTSSDKEGEVRELGAHEFVNTREKGALEKVAGKFDLIINTTNVGLDWDAYVGALAPRGVLHSVGAVPEFGVKQFFPLLGGQKSLSASPLGTPALVAEMLDFCARHRLSPVTETHPMSKINDAFEKLRSGSPRYRLVLEN